MRLGVHTLFTNKFIAGAFNVKLYEFVGYTTKRGVKVAVYDSANGLVYCEPKTINIIKKRLNDTN